MADAFETQLRERFQRPEHANPNLRSVATTLIQKLSRMPEQAGTGDLPYHGRRYALPLFMSIRDIAYGGWGSIRARVQNPNQFTLAFEIDHLGRMFEFRLKHDAVRGDWLSLAGYGRVTYFLKHSMSTDPEEWQNEVTEFFLDNCATYMPQLKHKSTVPTQTTPSSK